MDIRSFLFPAKPNSHYVSAFLLALRIILGVLLMTHGIQKLLNYNDLVNEFPDPIGIGHQASLILIIFAEVFCSLGFILGFLYRLALIPMIIGMATVFFVIHADVQFGDKELPFLYMILFIMLYISGPGRYSVDHYFSRKEDRQYIMI